jgi:cytochrome c oxidase subunit 2
MATIVLATPCQAQDRLPMNYLRSFGPKGDRIATLMWTLLLISIAVVVIMTALTLVGTWLRRAPTHDVRAELVTRRPGGIAWIVIGVGISTVVLFGSMVFTAYTMTAIHRPAVEPKLTIHVIGHRWWWELRYLNDDASRIFTTANEIHIPVGEPVRFQVDTADVIHSFWVPALGDKIDLIPNQTNENWLQASRAGIYRGQCAEYCGQQHAHMALLVVADEPADFQKWWDDQLTSAKSAEGQTKTAENLFTVRCGACHTVRGTNAGGVLGPDLTHLMSRKAIAAATIPNNTAYLSGWIADPQSIKPGNLMPTLDISGPELAAIRGFLETLR